MTFSLMRFERFWITKIDFVTKKNHVYVMIKNINSFRVIKLNHPDELWSLGMKMKIENHVVDLEPRGYFLRSGELVFHASPSTTIRLISHI